MRTLKLCLLLCGALISCGVSQVDDESMYLDGTEEHAVTAADGQKVCAEPKKVLVCHVPPGNPENAHDICVGTSALEAHQLNHGDTIGACEATPSPA